MIRVIIYELGAIELQRTLVSISSIKVELPSHNYDKITSYSNPAGSPYNITKVVITNGPTPSYSLNLRVGVTNTRPLEGAKLDLEAYTLCIEERPGRPYVGQIFEGI